MVRPGLGAAAAAFAISIALGWTTASSGFSLLSLLHIADEATMRYRVEVTLRVNGQVVRGSAVQEMTASTEIRTIPGTGGGLTAAGHGEAVAVDIPGRPTLFFLMSGPQGRLAWAERIVSGCGLNDPELDPIARLDKFRKFTGPCLLDSHHQPWIVRFADERDVGTIHEVILPERSGPDGDIDLVSVTVTRTEDELSTGLMIRLPWLAKAWESKSALLMVPTAKHGTTRSSIVVFRR